MSGRPYRGRIAPTPTGCLHIGHAATFGTAAQRAAGGELLLRIEDLDPRRCRPEYSHSAIEDLAWLGIRWTHGPVYQSERRARYLAAWRTLRDAGWIYPCTRSRKDVASSPFAPHSDEPVFPVAWRAQPVTATDYPEPGGVNWRFRVPDAREVVFHDVRCGVVIRKTLRDFGDFLVWNREDIPAYELAVVVDDAADGITEVVRGEDLLTSTARQILLYEAMGAPVPSMLHTPLVRDETGTRLAKRTKALSIRELRERGLRAEEVMALAMARLASSGA